MKLEELIKAMNAQCEKAKIKDEDIEIILQKRKLQAKKSK